MSDPSPFAADVEASDARGGEVVLRLTGAVDESDVAATTRVARELLRPAGIHTFLVDVGAVTFVDSSGLGLLVQLRRLAEDRGASFVLRDIPDKLNRLLELTGLLGYLAAE